MNVKTCLSQVFETRVRLAELIDQRSMNAPPPDLDCRIWDVWIEYIEQYIQARKLIRLFPDLRMKVMFTSRYLLFVKWEYIGEDIEITDIRYLFTLHADGIKQLQQAVNDVLVT